MIDELKNQKEAYEMLHDFVSPIAWFMSLPFCYAGFINEGLFSFLPSIPFFIMFYLIFTRYKSWIIKTVIIVSLIPGIFLFAEKSDRSKVFHPIVGKTLKNTKPMCLQKIFHYEHLYTLLRAVNPVKGCDYISDDGEKLVEKINVPINTLFKVTEVNSSGLFSNSFDVVVLSEFGEISIAYYSLLNDPIEFLHENGKAVQSDEIINRHIDYLSIFYLFFLLWPAYPLVFVFIYCLRKEHSLIKEYEKECLT